MTIVRTHVMAHVLTRTHSARYALIRCAVFKGCLHHNESEVNLHGVLEAKAFPLMFC